jgi:hypothetical protein
MIHMYFSIFPAQAGVIRTQTQWTTHLSHIPRVSGGVILDNPIKQFDEADSPHISGMILASVIGLITTKMRSEAKLEETR